MIEIRTGEYEVIYSGTVIGIIDEPIEIKFSAEYAHLRFVINFKNDESQIGTIVTSTPIDKTTRGLNFVNFLDALGTGNRTLLEVGYFNNRLLFLNYRVFAIAGISKTLHYTFYLGKEGSNATR